MKFFEHHFTKHHFVHAPHKWFFALLLSPIHAAEMRYKKVYHLNFIHARKLFFLDMSLLAAIIFLGATTLFWFFYDPAITDFVHIAISPAAHTDEQGAAARIASGDAVAYTLTYENKSDIALVDPVLRVDMPAGFIVERAFPKEQYNAGITSFELPDIPAQSSGTVEIGGIFFGQPDKEERISATLSYEQPDRAVREQKNASTLVVLRGSRLETTATFPETILAKGTFPMSIAVKNTSDRPMYDITIPFSIDPSLTLASPDSAVEQTKDGWYIPVLAPNMAVQIDGSVLADITERIDTKSIAAAGVVRTNGVAFAQEPVRHTFAIIRPEIALSAQWTNAETIARPGDILEINLTLQNTSNAEFNNLSITIPTIGSIVDTARLGQLNAGRIVEGSYMLRAADNPALRALSAGDTVRLALDIPIRSFPQGGTDMTFLLPIEVRGFVAGVADAVYSTQTESPGIAIGTALHLSTELRYYTNEGDQLGRGPLPPQVGEQTKYWVMIVLSNGTSFVSDARVSARLAPGVAPTGRSSVSLGNDVSYDSKTQTVSWSHSGIGPYQQVGIYFEVGFTPSAAQRGTTPTLVERINASARDTYINTHIETADGTLDTSLPDDPIGRQKGTTVR